MKFDVNTLIGLTEDEAVSKIENWGLIPRVFDEERTIGTMDFCFNRINISLEDGRVKRATIG